MTPFNVPIALALLPTLPFSALYAVLLCIVHAALFFTVKNQNRGGA